jgi:hypothetical protein
MASNEKSSKKSNAAFSGLQGDGSPSSTASFQSEGAEQHFGDDVEKTIPPDDEMEKANPSYDDENNQTQVSSGPDPNAFPDGGFQAWLAVAGGFCTIFASFGWINCENILGLSIYLN